MIAKAKILRQPQNHRLVCDGVSRVNKELDDEGQPQLASRALEHGEFRDETTQPCRYDRRYRFFDYFSHGAELARRIRLRRIAGNSYRLLDTARRLQAVATEDYQCTCRG